MIFFFLRQALHVKKRGHPGTENDEGFRLIYFFGTSFATTSTLISQQKCVHLADKKSTANIFHKAAQILDLDSYGKRNKWPYRGKLLRVGWKGFLERISSTATFSSSRLALSPLTFSLEPSAFGGGD